VLLETRFQNRLKSAAEALARVGALIWDQSQSDEVKALLLQPDPIWGDDPRKQPVSSE
jgi:hypothetical protein